MGGGVVGVVLGGVVDVVVVVAGIVVGAVVDVGGVVVAVVVDAAVVVGAVGVAGAGVGAAVVTAAEVPALPTLLSLPPPQAASADSADSAHAIRHGRTCPETRAAVWRTSFIVRFS
jgi:hypothetical protein